jgi:predicted nicotinamide N-methyase
VLEIGSGQGLAGIVASKCGPPADLWLTDVSFKSLDAINANLRLNSGVEMPSSRQTVVRTAFLDWDKEGSVVEESEEVDLIQPDLPSQKANSAGSGVLPPSMTFDIIIAADIIYSTEIKGVVDVIERRLSKGGLAIIICPAAKHRFGVTEFERLLDESTLLVDERVLLKHGDPAVSWMWPPPSDSDVPGAQHQGDLHIYTFTLYIIKRAS